MNIAQSQRLYDALKIIASYAQPERVRRDASKMGLDEDEAVEMAYENVLSEAKQPTEREKYISRAKTVNASEADKLEMDDETGLTEKGLRQLHEACCRQNGMTSDQIIADWNRRVPDDPW